MSKNKLKALETRITRYKNDIEDDALNSTAYGLLARAYVDKFKLTQDDENNKIALELFNEAIKLTNAEEPLYLAGRSELLVTMGEHGLALEDIITIRRLPEDNMPSDARGDHIRNVVSKITRLQEIQDSIDDLFKGGVINSSLASDLHAVGEIIKYDIVQLQHNGNGSDNNIKRWESAIKFLLEENIRKNAAIERLHGDVERIKIVEGIFQSEQDNIKNQILELSRDISSIRANLVDITQTVATRVNQSDMAQIQKEELNKVIASLQSSITSLSEQMNANDEVLSKAKVTLSSLLQSESFNKEMFENIKGKIETINNSLEDHNSRIDFLKAQLKNLSDITDSVQSQVRDSALLTEQQKEILNEDIDAIKKNAANMLERMDAREGTIERIIEDVSRLLEEGEASNDTFNMLRAKIKALDVRVSVTEFEMKALATRLEIQESKATELIDEIKQLGVNGEEIKEILPLLGTLSKVITKQQLADQTEEMLDGVMKDPYKGSFYDILRKDLNSTYLAASVVQTNIVKNSKSGVMGKLGAVLETAGKYVPMFGGGVQFFALILSKVDELQQKKFVANYANLASTTSEMESLSSKIAMTLACDRFNKEVLDRSDGSMKAKFINFISAVVKGSAMGVGKELIEGDIEGAISRVAATAIDKAGDSVSTVIAEKTVETTVFRKWNLFKKKEAKQEKEDGLEEKEEGRMEEIEVTSQTQRGVTHAHLISSLIIGKIFDGSINSKSGEIACVVSIESFIYAHFALDSENITANVVDDQSISSAIDDDSQIIVPLVVMDDVNMMGDGGLADSSTIA